MPPRAAALVAIALLACSDPAKPRTPATIAITPDEAVLCASETAQLHATVLDANGEEIRDVEISWSSSQSDIATVSASGGVTARSGGHAIIRASQGNLSGTADVRVRAPDVRIAKSEPWVFVGDTLRLSAEVVDLNDIVPKQALRSPFSMSRTDRSWSTSVCWSARTGRPCSA